MSALAALVACSSDDETQPPAPPGDIALETLEDTPVSGSVALDGASVGVRTLGTLGQLDLAADGAFTYTPNPNANGSDHLVLAVTRGDDTAQVNVDVTITPVNDAPTLTAPAEAATPSDRRLTVAPVTVGDVDDATLSVLVAVGVGGLTSVVDAPGVSTLTIEGTIADVNAALATVAYVPTVGTSSAVITWTVRDSAGLEATAMTSIQVLAPLSPPAAIADAFATTGNTVLVRNAAGGVLANDADADGAVTVTTTTLATSEGGSVTFAADGSFVYHPAVGFTGDDTFEYAIVDSDGNTASAGVTVSVAGLVWYVDAASTVETADGRSDTPFKTLAPATTAAAGGSTIYVREGAYTTGALVVPAGVQLAGSGVAVDIGASGVLTAGVAPDVTVSGSDSLTLESGTAVRGLAFKGTTPIKGASFTTITIEDVTVAQAYNGLDFADAGTLVLKRVSVQGSNFGVRVFIGATTKLRVEDCMLTGTRSLSLQGTATSAKAIVDVRDSDMHYVSMTSDSPLHVTFERNSVERMFYFVPWGRSHLRLTDNNIGQLAGGGINAGFVMPGYTGAAVDIIASGNILDTQHQSLPAFALGVSGATLCADLRGNASSKMYLQSSGAGFTAVLPGFNSATTTAQAYLISRGNAGTLTNMSATITGGAPCVAPETF